MLAGAHVKFVNQTLQLCSNSSIYLKHSNIYVGFVQLKVNSKEDVCKSAEKYLRIKLLSIILTKPREYSAIPNLDECIFDAKLLKQLYKKYDSFLNPERHFHKKELEKDYYKIYSAGLKTTNCRFHPHN